MITTGHEYMQAAGLGHMQHDGYLRDAGWYRLIRTDGHSVIHTILYQIGRVLASWGEALQARHAMTDSDVTERRHAASHHAA